jgi:hypothetical protein
VAVGTQVQLTGRVAQEAEDRKCQDEENDGEHRLNGELRSSCRPVEAYRSVSNGSEQTGSVGKVGPQIHIGLRVHGSLRLTSSGTSQCC